MDVGLSGCGEKVQHGSPQIVRDRELFWFHFLLFVSFQTSKRGKKKQKRKTLYSAWSSQLHHWKPVVQEQQRLLLVAGCNIGLSWCVCVSGLRNIWNTAHPPPYPFTYLLFLSKPLFWPQLSSRGWCGPPNRRVHILQSLSPEGFEFQTNTLKKFRPAPKAQGAKFHSAKLYGELAPQPPLQFPLPPPIVGVHQSEIRKGLVQTTTLCTQRKRPLSATVSG